MGDTDPSTEAWLEAIHSRGYVNARQLLRCDQDINVRGAGGITALHVAVQGHASKKTKKLLIDGADIHATNAEGLSPLQLAQRLGYIDFVCLMIRHPHLVRALTTRLGRAPSSPEIDDAMHQKSMGGFRSAMWRYVETQTHRLIEAARSDDFATVRAMLASGVITVDAVDTKTSETPFSAALASRRRRMCNFLLDQGAHCYGMCVVNGQPEYTLVVAAMNCDVAMVRRLCKDHGVLLSPQQSKLQTRALDEAIKLGSIEMIDTLLHQGVRADSYGYGIQLPWPAYHALRTGSGLPALTRLEMPFWLLAMACWYQDTTLISQLCETYAVLCDRAMMATHGASALFLAVYKVNLAIATDLLSRGVNVNQAIDRGLTGIVAAVCVDSVRMVHMLLDHGADASVVHSSISATTGYDESLVATAIYADAMACALDLLPLETRPRHRDQALYQAARRGDLELARRVLDDALPSTAQAFRSVVSKTSCPQMLDLLLSRCCHGEQGYGMHDLQLSFSYACRLRDSAIISVFLAHGMDINYSCQLETESPLMRALLLNYESGHEVARLLLDNGVLDNAVYFLSEHPFDTPPLVLVERWLRGAISKPAKTHLEGSRQLLLNYTRKQ